MVYFKKIVFIEEIYFAIFFYVTVKNCFKDIFSAKKIVLERNISGNNKISFIITNMAT